MFDAQGNACRIQFRFKDVAVGEWFDWIGGERPSFFLRCEKMSPRTYRDTSGATHRVGSINAKIYHLGDEP